MIKIIAVLCTLAKVSVCHEVVVTSSETDETLSMQSCYAVDKLAKWMAENHPTERLAKWKCVIGNQNRNAA